MEIIAFEKKTYENMVKRLENFIEEAEKILEDINRPELNWLDNMEVCQVLNISKRTLQTMRDNGTLPFSRINHKMYYKPSDVEKLLQRSMINKTNAYGTDK